MKVMCLFEEKCPLLRVIHSRLKNFQIKIVVINLNANVFNANSTSKSFLIWSHTVKLHKRGPLLQTAGRPFPLLFGQPSSALLSTAQAGGPPSVEIGWATKTIIFEDVRGHKMTSFFTCANSLGNLQFREFFFSPCSLMKIIRNLPRKIRAVK